MFRNVFSGKSQYSPALIAISAVMTALVCVTTILMMYPIPATEGFFNIGDAMIIVTALTFGSAVGAIAGGIGSSLADFIGGFYVYVIPTLVIKGVEGYLVGWISSKNKEQKFQNTILAWFIGGLAMVSGYFIVQVFMYGFAAAIVEAPFNFVQMAVSGIVGIPLSQALKRRFIM